MINDTKFPKYFRVDAIKMTCYILNRIVITPILNKTLYKLYKRKPIVSHFHAFGCKCLVLNNGKYNIGKFDVKVHERIFLVYSSFSKACRIFIKHILIIDEFVQVFPLHTFWKT